MAQALPAIFAAQAVSQVGQSYSQYEALGGQDSYQRTVTGIKRDRLAMKSEDTLSRGEEKAAKIYKGSRELKGKQRASYAGQGVQVDSGSAGQVQAESEAIGTVDYQRAKTNAWREAWGYQVASDALKSESQMKSIASRFKQKMTILTGGMNALQSGLMASYYYKGGAKTPKTPKQKRNR